MNGEDNMIMDETSVTVIPHYKDKIVNESKKVHRCITDVPIEEINEMLQKHCSCNQSKCIKKEVIRAFEYQLEGHENNRNYSKSIDADMANEENERKQNEEDSVQSENFKNRKNDEENGEREQKKTALQNFYHEKNIFITGGTGFLGKILVEKLLYSSPGIDNIYLLVRQKKGKDVYSRLDEIFDDAVFSRLKREFPKFRHKIVVVPGDCGAAGLGLSLADRQMLMEKINIVFHAAATVKFDEQLRTALATNVQAPLQLLHLAREMKNLQVMVHISTAYSNCHLGRIEERVYDNPVNLTHLEQLVDRLDDRQLDRMLPKILGPWPNTYTFTKALAENELKKNCHGVPLAIFRPAIVTSTAKEPISCWIDNMYGPTGVVAGAGKAMERIINQKLLACLDTNQLLNDKQYDFRKQRSTFDLLVYVTHLWANRLEKFATGVLRTLQCDASVTADVVPADLVVNCLLAAAEKSSRVNREQLKEPLVYNYVSSVENRITWGDFMHLNCKYGFTHPLSSAIWYTCITLNKSAAVNALYKLFLHLLPALILDGLYVCFGLTPKLLKVYRKIHKFSSVLSYFSTHEIAFSNHNVRRLWDDTSEADKKLYPFSMRDVSWPDYFSGYIGGIRTHLFKESDGTLQHARDKWNRLYYLHQLVRAVFITVAFFIGWTTLSAIYSRLL